MPQADAEIDKFRRGEKYQPPPSAFLRGGHLQEEELARFGPALRTESAQVREQIARLLSDLGKRADPLYSIGGQLIRVPQIISMLIKDGLSKADQGREASLSALQEFVPAPLLKPYEKELTSDLETHPSTTAFLLVAKVKPGDAAPVVQRLFATPRWSNELNARVAAAALGDAPIEKEYEDAFIAATIPKEKARLARILGLIGTESSLRILAGGLRTGLVINEVTMYKRSVRLDVLEALSYNFPDQPVLYETQINDDSGYARAERFCEERLGVSWNQPRPPYLKIMGYPIPIPPKS